MALLMNVALRNYMQQQHYSVNYPYLSFFEIIVDIPNNVVLEICDQIKRILTFQIAQDRPSITISPQQIPLDVTQNMLKPKEYINQTEYIQLQPQQNTMAKPKPNNNLQKGDIVLLIGDSLMQGVGMTLVSSLKKQGASPINLSKQNTGLTYIHYFNWAEELQNALQSHNVKYLVVMLGANDPWDMKDPQNQERYIKFKTSRWEETYRSRIQTLLALANTYKAQVFWYEIPPMKTSKLNDGISYLNTLYEDEVHKSGGIFLQSNTVLSDDGRFSAYITRDSKKIKVRANDGIHFSPQGSRILSALLLEQFHIQKPSTIKE